MSFGKGADLDPLVVKKLLKEMDKDVATRFVGSAFSLNPKRVKLAFEIALQEMAIREKEKKKKRQDQLKRLGRLPGATPDLKDPTDPEESKKAAKEILDSIAKLFKSPEYDIEVAPLNPEDFEDEEEDDE